WVHVQLHQQKGMISLSPPTICNSALLSHVAGFISIERFQSLATEGKMLSLSWWENEYAVLQWKNHVLHAKAQQEGRESIFDFYKISIAHITREYSFKKDKDNV
ncbi:antibiotic biosynthesis monooxygenase family protein, partial [Escherichia coli]